MPKKEYNRILGELESEIMKIVWEQGSVSVRDVLNIIKKKRKLAYTTIMTVMARLSGKGILNRRLKNDTYIYTPREDKKRFLASASRKIIHSLINECGKDIAVAQFIDIVENGNVKSSKAWRQKLKTIIK